VEVYFCDTVLCTKFVELVHFCGNGTGKTVHACQRQYQQNQILFSSYSNFFTDSVCWLQFLGHLVYCVCVKHVAEICFKVYQSRDGSRVAKKKTSSKRDDNNPTFNEAIIFSLSQQTLEVPAAVAHLTAHYTVAHAWGRLRGPDPLASQKKFFN